MKVIFIGDIVGKAGRKAVKSKLPTLLQNDMIDFTIANGENAAGGFGITPQIAESLLADDIDFLTSGNHVWDRKDIVEFMEKENVLLRPANYPEGVPGRGSALLQTRTGLRVGVINVAGRIFMENLECPFRVALQESEKLRKSTPIIIVDMHAEATSEKKALGWFLDGRVSAVIGTHTHVQTADERILPEGTAYITDAGMSGSVDSVIGVKKEIAIQRFLTQFPKKFETAKYDIQLQGVIIDIDNETGKSINIQRFNLAV
ncbi:MAG: TIGR00282 family metallophosphoesterase [Deltaproteobacteria bacterium]|nr:TIGR00282 family metallophosphoesterase [Deltaproteobacteria bacterium]